MNWALFYLVEPGYLNAMQTPLQRGRFLSAQDTLHSPPVIVIDEDFARKYFPGQDPIGKRVKRITSIITADAVSEMRLKKGQTVACACKIHRGHDRPL
jgi:hypothetical protein